MSNSAELLIYEASRRLAEDDDPEGALDALAQAIEVAIVARRQLELVRAKTLRGELLLQMGQTDEARRDFEDVLAVGEPLDPGLAGEEVASARENLARLAGSSSDEA